MTTMISYKLKALIIVVLFYHLNIFYLLSQESANRVNLDSLDRNTIQLNVEKSVNSYFFTGNADYEQNSPFGKFDLSQSYKGTAMIYYPYGDTILGIKRTKPITAFRDDEALRLNYSYPLDSSIILTARQNWQLTADSKDIGLNKLEKINVDAGLRTNYYKKSYIEARGGFEKNNQIGIAAVGPSLYLNGKLYDYDVEGYLINSNLMGSYVKLNPLKYGSNLDRTNSDFDISTNVNHQYDIDSRLDLNFRYKMLNSDYYSFLNTTNFGGYLVESRMEKRFNTDLNLDFVIAMFPTNFKMSLSNVNLIRDFRNNITDFTLSGVERELHEFQLSFTGTTSYESGILKENIGISYDLRNEENLISNKFHIDKTTEQLLRTQEYQRDNNTTRTRLFSGTILNVSRKDTLTANFSVSLQQYDTPSNLNYDDRDEFSTIGGLRLSHKFSSILYASIYLETQFNHLVFIKAQRSAMNNWNRILKLSPSVTLITPKLKMNPNFEVLANYTVYDFESPIQGINSFSFRQVGYKDSIVFSINKKYSLQSRIFIRYFERGIFYWNSFSESPQNSNYEQYTSIMLMMNEGDLLSIGCGFVYYELSQKKLTTGAAIYGSSDMSHLSYGPAVNININNLRWGQISFRGSYEFQKINHIISDKIPNFYINTTFHL
jgi:hypothetical protein